MPRKKPSRILIILAILAFAIPVGSGARPQPTQPTFATGFNFFKYVDPQPLCVAAVPPVTGETELVRRLIQRLIPPYSYTDLDCGFAEFDLVYAGDVEPTEVRLIDPETGKTFETVDVLYDATKKRGTFDIIPSPTWPSGEIDFQVVAKEKVLGGSTFGHNLLQASLAAVPKSDNAPYRPGESVPVAGTLFEVDSRETTGVETPVAGTFTLRIKTPAGKVIHTVQSVTAGVDGTFTVDLPGSVTAGLKPTPETNFRINLAAEAIKALYEDPLKGTWAAALAGTGPVGISVPPTTLIVENSFVSSVGWVKPGATYPFRILIKNYTDEAASGIRVTVPPVDGTTFTRARSDGGGSEAILDDGSIAWTLDSIPAGTAEGPAVRTLVAEAKADSTRQDPQIVWKNLSSTATLTYTGGPSGGLSSQSHGPKVIPSDTRFDAARYGDRPFPVVPVDYRDRKHDPAANGDRLATVINASDYAGSTYNLYQEMSHSQLFPRGTVPSAGMATAGWDVEWKSARYAEGFQFTMPNVGGTCHGVTLAPIYAQALPERIHDGWYQLPGDTDYYGDDRTGSAIPVVVAGAPVNAIDNACGPTGKAVFDAAHIADPDIDYSDYDTDKDGIVDFFMMVYTGLGGNGVSQLQASPPYDNIWPHSSSLESYYTDAATSQAGYVSDDQLKDLEGRLLYYTNEARANMTTTATDFPVYVRVGPYNVNPESAVEKASVISHEYGHSLGLPDYYSTGGRETYGDWNLMATDKSQNMDVVARVDLGWEVPTVLPPGETLVEGFRDSKINTHRIDWVQPDGTPYTLEGPGVNNGRTFLGKLVGKQLIDPEKVATSASAPYVWWSQSGDDFGCTPEKGHNLDVFLPDLAALPGGSTVEVTLKHFWDIEWDWDYGFVLYSTNGGTNYTSMPSAKNYTTPSTFNPNAITCLDTLDNGLTGSSTSHSSGTASVDRVKSVQGTAGTDVGGSSYPDGPFVPDAYDLSAAVGKETVLRFSYATDGALARPGWFIDDLKVVATLPDNSQRVIYETAFDGGENESRVFNGGCKADLRVAAGCTDGWQWVSSTAGSPADHAYLIEMRDRSGFDFKGKDQNDRAPIGFLPGLLLTYTNEADGIGNVGIPATEPPAQSPLDSQPDPENIIPNLHDAAFTAAEGDSSFSDSGSGHVDNYVDPAREDGLWRFDFACLSFDVLSMAGDGIGPAAAPGDLTADVRFRMGQGCARFDYGFSAASVTNTLPQALLAVSPKSGTAPLTVRFDGSDSSDPDGSIASWVLSFGDGTANRSGTGKPPGNISHVYRDGGTFTARLTVVDAAGAKDAATAKITVRGGPRVGGSKQLPATGVGGSWVGLVPLGVAIAGLAWLRRGRPRVAKR